MKGLRERFGRPLRLALIGGGPGSWIGRVHQSAAELDGYWRVVGGVVSSDPARSRDAGAELGFDRARSYGDLRELLDKEKAREDGIDAVAIMTPNDTHYPYAVAALDAGLDVVCDKPVTHDFAQACDLVVRTRKKERVFAIAHGYSAYPMTRYVRELVRDGILGALRLVQVEYIQSGLATKIEDAPQNNRLRWLVDPRRSGLALVMSAIGCHAQHLACFVSGLTLDELSADMTSFVKGRKVDDNVNAMLRFKNGARGMLWASQVAPGNENGLRLRVYGTKGGIDWTQADPNYLWFTPFGHEKRLITRGGAGAGAAAGRVTRVPPGHPEGYLEGFANIYTEAARAIIARRSGKKTDKDVMFPGIEDGVAGMAFIEACKKSSAKNGKWTKV